MVMIKRAVIGLHGESHAQATEAYGCRVGLRLLLDIRSGTRVTRVAGDNFNVVRYCASEGRIRKPHIQDLLEGPLGDCAARGWAVNWAAVRRRENEAADGAATGGYTWLRGWRSAGARSLA